MVKTISGTLFERKKIYQRFSNPKITKFEIHIISGPHVTGFSFRTVPSDGTSALHTTSTTAATAHAHSATSGLPDRAQAKVSPVLGSDLQLSPQVQPLHVPNDRPD